MADHAQASIRDAINTACPFSGRPVAADSLTVYRGRVIGFCNPGCRDKFAADPDRFPDAVAALFGATTA